MFSTIAQAEGVDVLGEQCLRLKLSAGLLLLTLAIGWGGGHDEGRYAEPLMDHN